jgi:putative two-component system response regulator
MSDESENLKLDVNEAYIIEDATGIALHLARRLAQAAEYRLHGDSQHIKRMREFALYTARKLGPRENRCQTIAEASQLHDVGMVAIPDSILLKPEELTDEERATMESHTTTGARLLGRVDNDFIRTARAIAISHHEKWDGSGYPNGLSGNDIPIEARIVGVADTFDAMQSSRPYRRSVTPNVAMTLMEQGGDGHFDPRVLKAFIACKDDILEVCDRIPNR